MFQTINPTWHVLRSQQAPVAHVEFSVSMHVVGSQHPLVQN